MHENYQTIITMVFIIFFQSSNAVRKSTEDEIVVTAPVDEVNRKRRIAYEKAEKVRDSKRPVVGIDHSRNALHVRLSLPAITVR